MAEFDASRTDAAIVEDSQAATQQRSCQASTQESQLMTQAEGSMNICIPTDLKVCFSYNESFPHWYFGCSVCTDPISLYRSFHQLLCYQVKQLINVRLTLHRLLFICRPMPFLLQSFQKSSKLVPNVSRPDSSASGMGPRTASSAALQTPSIMIILMIICRRSS